MTTGHDETGWGPKEGTSGTRGGRGVDEVKGEDSGVAGSPGVAR